LGQKNNRICHCPTLPMYIVNWIFLTNFTLARSSYWIKFWVTSLYIHTLGYFPLNFLWLFSTCIFMIFMLLIACTAVHTIPKCNHDFNQYNTESLVVHIFFLNVVPETLAPKSVNSEVFFLHNRVPRTIFDWTLTRVIT
jgi:hypothetical protein